MTSREAEAMKPKPRFQLKALIVASGFNYTEYSRSLGIDLSHLSRICNGHSFPSVALQKRIAATLGITLRELSKLL